MATVLQSVVRREPSLAPRAAAGGSLRAKLSALLAAANTDEDRAVYADLLASAKE